MSGWGTVTDSARSLAALDRISTRQQWRVASATLLVALAQASYSVFVVYRSHGIDREPGWESQALALAVVLNVLAGILPFLAAFGLALAERYSLAWQLSAVLVASVLWTFVAGGVLLLLGFASRDAWWLYPVSSVLFYGGLLLSRRELFVRPEQSMGRGS